MLNIIKADMRSIKPWEYMILIPAVLFFALLVGANFVHPYYMWIFYLTLGLCSGSVDRKRQEKVLPSVVSLPITRKEYIGAKYLLAVAWFFVSSIVTMLFALVFNRSLVFFSFEMWITTFLITLVFIAIYVPFSLFYKSAGFMFGLAIVIFIMTTRETIGHVELHFHPIFLLSIILFYLSYYFSVKVFERLNIS
ncbi:ABC-2 transporter permease [Lederbergia citrea]|uniref:ABC-2 transporter permease n=1 Tax=Lederbergia citrea TaxID=2833581 RepID=UPI001BC9C38B|nr:ABC-2 transporter permease [Lederbergia citrea]MBS4179268.1 ABC-2 transporter permease [Lederbergia citrea]